MATRSTARPRAETLARALIARKASSVVVLDLRRRSPITSFFVVATATSPAHAQALARHLADQAKPDHIEGIQAASWVLLDYLDVIVHIFLEDVRRFYGLERLWGDAPKLALDDSRRDRP